MRVHKNNSPHNRFKALDGLRGVAVLLVLLNHVDSYYIIQSAPSFFQQFISFFFASGKLGVSFFFLLAGLLAARLHPHPNSSEFIEKRYARIFPPFITLIISMTVFRSFPQLSLFSRITIMVLTAYALRLIWISVIEKYRLGSVSIKLFIFFQLLTAVWYGIVIMRMPIGWFHSLHPVIQIATNAAVNMTLMIPLGNYIPFLDLLYWTMIGEVLFYVLYPYIIAPVVNKIEKRSFIFKTIFILFLFPFFFGTSVLFSELRGFNIISIEYFIYFCIGIVISFISQNKDSAQLRGNIKKLFHPIFFLCTLFLSYIFYINTTQLYRTATVLLLVVPLGFIIYGVLDEDTSLARFLSKKTLVFLGSISYSIYICSTPLIDGMRLLYKTTNLIDTVIFSMITMSIVLLISYVIYKIIETPYFRSKGKSETISLYKDSSKMSIVLLTLFFIFSLFSVYSSQYNFFSAEHPYDISVIKNKSITSGQTIILTETQLMLEFKAPEDNLGIISFHITNESVSKSPLILNSKTQQVVVRMKEKNAHDWFAVQKTDTAQIGKSLSYPFGFPQIQNSKGKIYHVEISLENQEVSSQTLLHTDESAMKSIHQANKKQLITHPLQLLSHMMIKLQNMIQNGESRLVLASILPFLILYIYLAFKR